MERLFNRMKKILQNSIRYLYENSMMGYLQLVIAARKMESEVADVKEVRSKAASVEVTSAV